ncbi:mercury(II) reductase [Arthrobacter roseus]|uniref:mercury(II) reductase n=1 Tax=Arthrobacter roseus TaxID=136274 RepID=UPI001964FBE4|nr:mercury(II) reductase [Arthrobacter roseus]MBM7846791.1 mercuric reductase [Arthrobacter roseus]
MAEYEFDLAVVGSGGAAMAAAITARQSGKTVVLIERAVLGGTCVNVGCVPSKTLLAAAGNRHAALNNPFPGAPTSAGTIDLQSLLTQKDALIEHLRGAKYADVAASYGFEIRAGEASFLDNETLAVDGVPLSARSFIVATGAGPALPEMTGLDEMEYLTSTSAMEQTSLPESLIVIGGGYVGLEQAQLFAHLGSTVTIIGRIAPAAEPELASILRTALIDAGIIVVEEHAVSVSAVSGGVTVSTGSRVVLHAEKLLIATGRTARTDGLNLDAAGVAIDEQGFITVDDRQRTSNPRVFAAGDVTGGPQYVYVAAASGKAAAHNALQNSPADASARLDYTGLPAVIFTRPQLAIAGLTEAEAVAGGYQCECRVLGFEDLPRALVNHDTNGAIKMVADAHTGQILGLSAVGDGVGEIMLAATYAIRAGMTTRHIIDTWAPYLTMSESFRLVAGLFHNEMPTSCCA